MSSHTEGLPLLDLGNAMNVFSDNLAKIEQFGPVSHLVFGQVQIEPGTGGKPCNVIIARMIVPTALLAKLARQLSHPQAAASMTAADDDWTRERTVQ